MQIYAVMWFALAILLPNLLLWLLDRKYHLAQREYRIVIRKSYEGEEDAS